MDGSSGQWFAFSMELAVALLIAVGVVVAVYVTLGLVGRRNRFSAELLIRIRLPLALTLPLTASALVMPYLPNPAWSAVLGHALVIVVIASGGWLVAAGFLAVVDYNVSRSQLLAAETAEGRRLRTQLSVLRRI